MMVYIDDDNDWADNTFIPSSPSSLHSSLVNPRIIMENSLNALSFPLLHHHASSPTTHLTLSFIGIRISAPHRRRCCHNCCFLSCQGEVGDAYAVDRLGRVAPNLVDNDVLAEVNPAHWNHAELRSDDLHR